jgi:hypothetical protein
VGHYSARGEIIPWQSGGLLARGQAFNYKLPELRLLPNRQGGMKTRFNSTPITTHISSSQRKLLTAQTMLTLDEENYAVIASWFGKTASDLKQMLEL